MGIGPPNFAAGGISRHTRARVQVNVGGEDRHRAHSCRRRRSPAPGAEGCRPPRLGSCGRVGHGTDHRRGRNQRGAGAYSARHRRPDCRGQAGAAPMKEALNATQRSRLEHLVGRARAHPSGRGDRWPIVGEGIRGHGPPRSARIRAVTTGPGPLSGAGRCTRTGEWDSHSGNRAARVLAQLLTRQIVH